MSTESRVSYHPPLPFIHSLVFTSVALFVPASPSILLLLLDGHLCGLQGLHCLLQCRLLARHHCRQRRERHGLLFGAGVGVLLNVISLDVVIGGLHGAHETLEPPAVNHVRDKAHQRQARRDEDGVEFMFLGLNQCRVTPFCLTLPL